MVDPEAIERADDAFVDLGFDDEVEGFGCACREDVDGAAVLVAVRVSQLGSIMNQHRER